MDWDPTGQQVLVHIGGMRETLQFSVGSHITPDWFMLTSANPWGCQCEVIDTPRSIHRSRCRNLMTFMIPVPTKRGFCCFLHLCQHESILHQGKNAHNIYCVWPKMSGPASEATNGFPRFVFSEAKPKKKMITYIGVDTFVYCLFLK